MRKKKYIALRTSLWMQDKPNTYAIYYRKSRTLYYNSAAPEAKIIKLR